MKDLLVKDVKALLVPAIVAFILAVAADANGFADDLVDGDWTAVHSLMVAALAAAYEAGGRALASLVDKAFPPGNT